MLCSSIKCCSPVTSVLCAMETMSSLLQLKFTLDTKSYFTPELMVFPGIAFLALEEFLRHEFFANDDSAAELIGVAAPVRYVSVAPSRALCSVLPLFLLFLNTLLHLVGFQLEKVRV